MSFRQEKLGVLLGFIVLFLTNISNIILTPLLLASFGDEYFGVYRIAIGILSFIALADMGMTNGVVRFVSEFNVKPERQRIQALVTIVLVFYLLVSIFLLLVYWLFSPLLLGLFKDGLSSAELQLLSKLVTLVIFCAIINLFTNCITAIFKGFRKFAQIKYFQGARIFIRLLLFVTLLNFEAGPYVILLADLLISCLFLLFYVYYLVSYLKIVPGDSKKLGFPRTRIFSYTGIVFVDALAYQAFWGAPLFLAGALLGSVEAAIVAISMLVVTTFLSLSIVISDVLMPAVLNASDSHSPDKLQRLSVDVARAKAFVLGLPTVIFLSFGDYILFLWLGSEYSEVYMISSILIVGIYVSSLADVGMFALWAKNKHLPKSLLSILVSIFSVSICYLLVLNIGVIGIALGTLISIFIGQVIAIGVLYQFLAGINVLAIYKSCLAPVSSAFILSVILENIWGLHNYHDVILLVSYVILAFALYLLVALKLFNTKEKSVLLALLTKHDKSHVS